MSNPSGCQYCQRCRCPGTGVSLAPTRSWHDGGRADGALAPPRKWLLHQLSPLPTLPMQMFSSIYSTPALLFPSPAFDAGSAICRVFFYILQRKARLLQQSNTHRTLPGLGGTSSAPLLSPHPSFSLSVTARALTVAFGVTSPQSEVFSPMLSGLGRSNLSLQVAREGRASSAP